MQKLREANADSVMMINSPGVSGGLIRAATTFGVRPLWSHNTGSIGEPEAAQIGAPSEGMLLGGIYPSFRDTNLPGIKRFVAEMTASGKASDEINLKPLGINSWLSVYAVAEAAKWIKGDTVTRGDADARDARPEEARRPVRARHVGAGRARPRGVPALGLRQGVLPHRQGREDRLLGQPAARGAADAVDEVRPLGGREPRSDDGGPPSGGPPHFDLPFGGIAVRRAIGSTPCCATSCAVRLPG